MDSKEPKITVYTSGSWDLFHVGHLNLLEKSRTYGTHLIVGVSTDELIENYKGVKPVIPYQERKRIIESLRCVDKVIEQTILTDIAQLKEYNIDIVTIGDDWEDKYLAGLEWMKQNQKQVIYLPYTKGVSTTSIKKTIIDDAQKIVIASLNREIQTMEQHDQELSDKYLQTIKK